MDYRERWEHKDYLKGRTLEARIRLFHVLVALLVSLFALNFWYLQGVRGDHYTRLAETNRLRRIPRLPTRGVVFDRNGEVLASSRPSLDLVLLREDSSDQDPQLRRLAPILGEEFEDLVERREMLAKAPLYAPLVLTEDVELGQLARIESRREHFPSVEVRESLRRDYPAGAVFAHMLGYVGEASEEELVGAGRELRLGDVVGKVGLELSYDAELRGHRGWNLVTVNNLGRRMSDPWVGREPEHGKDVRLTVDLNLQRTLIEALGDEVGAGVFLDPKTGEVLAIGSTPGFDPGRFADGMTARAWRGLSENPSRPLLSRATGSMYAPGSTFKVIMAIAGLEDGAVTPDETMFCNGQTSVYGNRRLCWKPGGHGHVDVEAALAHSCNVYFYHLGKRLGIDRIHHYGAAFGLGMRSGIDLPGEEDGILPSRAWKRERYREPWYPGDTISVAIGQGLLAVTPLQAARMIAGVANSGRIPVPHLRYGARSPSEPVAVSPATFAVVRAALRRAVESGTGTRAGLGPVSVAGKTGTAQVYKHSAGIDSDDLPKHERDHAWFVGYAPVDDPRIAFAVIVEHGGHGGTAAAPVVRAVLERFFSEELAVRTEDVAQAH